MSTTPTTTGLTNLINNPSTSLEGLTESNSTRNTGGLGKDDFLQLLVTQLKNQDPLDPMKNEQFVAQLAQFNSLEQMLNLNKSFSQMLSLQQLTQAAGFIGGNVSWMDPNGAEQSGIVTGVNMNGGSPTLQIGTGGVEILPSDVISIKQ